MTVHIHPLNSRSAKATHDHLHRCATCQDNASAQVSVRATDTDCMDCDPHYNYFAFLSLTTEVDEIHIEIWSVHTCSLHGI